jgi:hypothetical protein
MDDALQTNAADGEQLGRAKRKVADRLRNRGALVRQQMSTYEGRMFVWEELAAHGIYEDVSGPVEVVYQFVGRRREGLRLLAEVTKHPQFYLQMQSEAMARADRERRENQAARVQEQQQKAA